MKLIHFCIAVVLSISSFGQKKEALQLDKDLLEIYKKSQISGIGVALFDSDKTLFSKGYGYSNIKEKIPFTIQAVQNIGSISKTFIGVTIGMLVDQKKLDLDNDINDYLPFQVRNPKYPDTPITLRQLATHTSSICDSDFYEKSYVLDDDLISKRDVYTKSEYEELENVKDNVSYTLSDFLENYLIPDKELYSKKNFSGNEPGTIYEYSNIASALAALVVQEVTGISYKTFVEEQIFKPINMKKSFWDHSQVPTNELSINYTTNLQPVPRYHLNTYPDGGVHTNINDLVMYIQQVMKTHKGDAGIFSKGIFNEMLAPQMTNKQLKKSKLKHNSGLFWELKNSGSIGHSGADPGVLTLMYFDPKKDIGAIIFTNCTAHYDESMMSSIKNIWKVLIDFKDSIH